MQSQLNGPVVIQPPTRGYPLDKSVIGMGIALIVIGSLSIVAQIAGMSISISLADSGAGIWSGIFVIILIHYSLQIQGFNPVADSGTPRGPAS